MMDFYKTRHDTANNPGMPEIEEIVEGLVDLGKCSVCGGYLLDPSGDLRVRLGNDGAKMWPDVIACGDYSCFVVSERFVKAMEKNGIRLIFGGTVDFVEPVENGLSLDDAPQYFWIDGERHFAAKMDFDASGFVDVRFCEECGRRTNNIGLTYDQQEYADPPIPYVFDYDAGSGLDLFTTDLAPTAFFCTARVLDCARSNKLTNLRFSPVEQGVLGKPVKY